MGSGYSHDQSLHFRETLDGCFQPSLNSDGVIEKIVETFKGTGMMQFNEANKERLHSYPCCAS